MAAAQTDIYLDYPALSCTTLSIPPEAGPIEFILLPYLACKYAAKMITLRFKAKDIVAIFN